MNNPLRELLQRRFEARRLRRLGGPLNGGRVLEIGCGRGVGIEIILNDFGADTVHGFDLDPRMVRLAARRTARCGERVSVWLGDASAISAADASYDAVFDFGIVHHIPNWRRAVAEIGRVLKPGGRFYGEEVLEPFIVNPLIRSLLRHPLADRFDRNTFAAALRQSGLRQIQSEQLGRSFAWFTALKPA
ncbi:MAG: class I SAM-dependent methyltransferase [Xanthomonadales bacterium]|nr:class I SAM-dependent methyltransferase [Xanthomonadales bacterium]